MKAVKCDRCGKYFDDEIGVIKYLHTASDDHYHLLDICPDCLEKFYDFMQPKKTEAMQNKGE